MPTYEYRCNACGHKWDEFQSIKAAPTRKCPTCRKLKAERVISAGGGIIFRGSGFYQTDYRSDSWKKGEEAAKKASDSGTSSGGADKTSKPAAGSGSSGSGSSGCEK
ncbi:MAG: FmdB family zinc ribbon protein [Planctomycetaceae bacterium]